MYLTMSISKKLHESHHHLGLLPTKFLGTINSSLATISMIFPAAIKPAVPVTKHAVPRAPSHRLKEDDVSLPRGNSF
jgi:hypothetical protein